MTEIEERIAKALRKQGVAFASLEPIKENCMVCGLGSPDFSMNGRTLHFECVPYQAMYEQWVKEQREKGPAYQSAIERYKALMEKLHPEKGV